MDIESELKELSSYYSLEFLKGQIKMPLEFLNQPPLSLHPSIVIGRDGLVLERLFITTSDFLCDVELDCVQCQVRFDIAPKSTIKNYRVSLTLDQPHDGEQGQKYSFATVQLIHNLSGQSLQSVLTFAEKTNQRHKLVEWVNKVSKAIPVSSMI